MTVLITGANRGMGLGYVAHYLAQGYQVIGTYRDLSRSQALHELQRKYPNKLRCLSLDVTDPDSIAAVAATLRKMKIKLALVVNNAGISKEEKFGQWSAGNFENHFAVNTIGPALVVQMTIPFMLPNSKIVQITSGMGSLNWNIDPDNGLDAYAASKSALHLLSLRLAEKLRPKKIGIYLMSPGWVKTDMGGPEALYSVKEAVKQVTATLQKLTLAQSGSLLSEKGTSIPW